MTCNLTRVWFEDKGIEMRESWWREIFRQCLQGT